MPEGFLSRIIYALIRKQEKTGCSPAADNARMESGKNNISSHESSGAKEWVPDIFAKPMQQGQLNGARNTMHQGINADEAMAKAQQMAEGRKSGNKIPGDRVPGSFSAAIEKIRKNRVLSYTPFIIAALLLVLSFTPLFSYIKAIAIIIALILIGAASKLVQKFFPFVVGFDLCLLFTVLAGVAYHPFAGVLVGVFSSTLGSVARGQDDMSKVIVPALGYVVVALMIPFFSGMQILTLGMIMTLAYSVMMSVAFWFLMHCSTNTVTFLVSSLAFNYWLFVNYAAPILSFMSG